MEKSKQIISKATKFKLNLNISDIDYVPKGNK